VSLDPYSGADAYSFTSLEGVSYALNANGWTALTLTSDWTNAAYSTRNVAASLSGGIVRLQGGVYSAGTNTALLTLPAQFRPSGVVYVSTDAINSAPGRLIINTDGSVSVQGAVQNSDALGFTSLEGVWFALNATGFTALSPVSPWGPTVYGTRNAAAQAAGGLVRFQGAISSPSGTTGTMLFTLPAGLRPAASVWTPLGLCSGKKGRLNISSSGVVYLNIYSGTGGGTMDDATCFTSLEGVSFGL
jgi:hypothetical protein